MKKPFILLILPFSVVSHAVAQTAEHAVSEGKVQPADGLLAPPCEVVQPLAEECLTVVGIVGLALLLGLVVVHMLLRRSTERAEAAIAEIQRRQGILEEAVIGIDSHMATLVELATNRSAGALQQCGEDHELALKVADEIIRIELNLSRMDPALKGYKQLTKAVERIKNNFQAKGYEISSMLGQPYHEGMRIHADFVADESLTPGTSIITSVTKPQVVFNGQLIQKAIVTVTQNI